jgi:hypothetical protein
MDTDDRKDVERECVDCRQPFIVTAHEQKFFEERGLSQPKRCKSCRADRRRERAQGQERNEGTK